MVSFIFIIISFTITHSIAKSTYRLSAVSSQSNNEKRSALANDPFNRTCTVDGICSGWVKSSTYYWNFVVSSTAARKTIFFMVFDYDETGITFSTSNGFKMVRTPSGAASFRGYISPYTYSQVCYSASVSTYYTLPSSTYDSYILYDQLCPNTEFGCFSEKIDDKITNRIISVQPTIYVQLIYYIMALFTSNCQCTVLATGTDPNVVIASARDPGNTPIKAVPLLSCTASNDYDLWGFSLYYNFRWGDLNAIPEFFLYDFPYVGNYSIMNPYQFQQNVPYDQTVFFNLPEGTPVYSARNGIVASVRYSQQYSFFDVCPIPVTFDCNKTSIYDNYVLIRHYDDTLMWYGSLKFNGIYVKSGDVITKKTLLATSGKTGYTPNGPVLVLQLEKPLPYFPNWYSTNYLDSVNLPITFNNGHGSSITPTVGQTYTATYSYPPGTVSESGKTETTNAIDPNIYLIAGIVSGIIVLIIIILIIWRCKKSQPIKITNVHVTTPGTTNETVVQETVIYEQNYVQPYVQMNAPLVVPIVNQYSLDQYATALTNY